MILEDYDERGVRDRLGKFNVCTVKADKKGPKLGGTAACVRALIPFGRKLAELMLSVCSTPVTQAMCAAATNLHYCYEGLSSGHAFAKELMKDHGQQFCLQYGALRDALGGGNTNLWKMTPKFHIFLHMVEDGSRPAMYWAYRDEAFGGTIAKLAKRRGGPKTPLAMSRRVLDNFRIKEPVLRMSAP